MFKNYDPTYAYNDRDEGSAKSLYQKAVSLYAEANNEQKQKMQAALTDQLYEYLKKASELESLLCFQYLYAAFSMKKYDAELSGSEQSKLRQIELIRRWEARILYVARQEMEHMNLVQNLLVLIDKPPYLQRPNYPVSAELNPLGYPINLLPFSKETVETFRFWEKPDELKLPFPDYNNLEGANEADDLCKASSKKTASHQAFNIDDATIESWKSLIEILNESAEVTAKDDLTLTIEKLYNRINICFHFALNQKIIDVNKININRIVEEHFGFNMQLDPIVKGKYYEYVNDVISQILQEGEGVWGVPPALGSHFMVYQDILNEFTQELKLDPLFAPGLPGVVNPATTQPVAGQYQITNPVAICAIDLFNMAYEVLDYMLYGFFLQYSIDYTTGIRPPIPNSFFRTSFYPFMTMVIRPLGEMVSRLPADSNYTPVPGQIPNRTAGPNFFYNPNGMPMIYEKLDPTINSADFVKNDFIVAFSKLAEKTNELRLLINQYGYHMANAGEKDSRDFDVRLQYLQENLERIAINFDAYWEGKMDAPVPSKNFQNFSNQYN